MIGGDVLRRPRAGDVALFEVQDVSWPGEVLNERGERRRLAARDQVLGVFGNCQLNGTLEARVQGLTGLSLVGSVGLVGNVHQSPPGRPLTRMSFLGYGLDSRGERLNLRTLLFRPRRLRVLPQNVFLVVGASAGCGERSVLLHLRAGLVAAGMRVAVCRLTCPRPAEPLTLDGSRDLHEYGFLSSHGCSAGELRELFQTMLSDLAQARPDVVLVVVEGGLLQREAKRVLSDPKITRHVQGVLLAAACATSALFALRWLGSRRHRVVAVSGVLSSAPLLVGEFSELARVPVGSADGVGRQLVHVLLDELRRRGDAMRVPPAAAGGGSAAPAAAREPARRWRRGGGGGGA